MTKTAEITILGCGGSGGVPLATNYWGNCDPQNPRNRRTRASIAIRTERTCVVIDTGPDFRAQTLRENIDNIDAILYSHPHSDHVNGMDDVRYVAIKQRILGQADYKTPIFADAQTLDDIHQRFPYLFRESDDGLYIPLMEVHEMADYEPLNIGDLTIHNFVQIHGYGRSLGFRVGDVAYSTDVSGLDDKSFATLDGVKTWIVDCGQYGADFTTVHANFDCVMDWQKRLQCDKLYLTHLTPRNDYDTINRETPDFVECAYDGLKILANL